MFGIDDAVLGTLAGSIGGSMLSGGSTLLGGLFQSQSQQQNAQTAFMNNMASMQQQEAYNTQMANTAYQRSVADMKAAGLNPILAAGGFSGAGGAGVGQASAPMAGSTDILGGAVSSAQQGSKLFSEISQLGKQVDAMEKEIDKKDAEIDLTKQQQKTEAMRTATEAVMPESVKADAAQKRATAEAQSSAARVTKLEEARRQADLPYERKYGSHAAYGIHEAAHIAEEAKRKVGTYWEGAKYYGKKAWNQHYKVPNVQGLEYLPGP